MSTNIATRPTAPLPEAVEQVLVGGDLSKLSTAERLKFYLARCEAAGLDPRCRPFEYLSLNGKLVLYAKKEAAEQLNGLHGISHSLVHQTHDEKQGLIEVMVQASMKGGRSTVDIGIVPSGGLKGPDLANAKMKAMTKAKRRATLSLCGLGDVVDETELDTLTNARPCTETGQLEPPDNQSGHGRGQYASAEQVESYLKAMEKYLAEREAKWLDHWQDKDTGELPQGIKGAVVNRWQADNHLVKWAVDTKRLDAVSLPEGGIKNRQIGLYTAIVYHRTPADRKALSQELRDYIDMQERRAIEAFERSQPKPEAVEPEADDEFEDGLGEGSN